MDHSLSHKLAAVAFAVLMNGLVLSSVSYLFAGPATAMSQPVGGASGIDQASRGIA